MKSLLEKDMLQLPTLKQTPKFSPLTIAVTALISGWLGLAGCQSQATKAETQQSLSELAGNTDKLLIVDCLLPGQVRKLGSNMTYVSPRRPVKTTASECEIRGGEYVAFDRADYRTSLRVWLPQAQQGDPEAQNYVGEIYEKGLGIEPDYQTAAAWYRKAADQGNSRARINLGFLYEKGFGVKKDLAEALNWYRKASGLESDNLQFSSSVEISKAERNELRLLKQERQQQKAETDRLRKQLKSTKGQLSTERSKLAKSEQRMLNLRKEIDTRTVLTAPVAAVASNQQELEQLRSKLVQQEQAVKSQQKAILQLESSLTAQQQEMSDALRLSSQEKQALEQALSEQTSQASALKGKYDQAQAELAKANQVIASNQPKLAAQRNQLEQAQQSLLEATNKTITLENQVADLQRDTELKESAMGEQGVAVTKLRKELLQYEQRLQTLEQAKLSESSNLKQDIASREQEISGLKAKLSQSQQQLELSQQQISQLNPDLARQQKLLFQTQKELVSTKTAAARKELELKRLRDSEQSYLDEIQEQQVKIDRYQAEALRYRTQLADLRNQRQTAALSGPTIEILDPPIALTRGMPSVRLRSASKERIVTGKVSAPAGLVSFTVNDQTQAPDPLGIFSTKVKVENDQTPVKMVAVDKKGQRTSLEFLLIPKMRNVQQPQLISEKAVDPIADTKRLIGEVDFGEYHALVIGNNQYSSFPNLVSASTDAQQTAELLRDKYGFKTTVLMDATRYDMLSALNKLREELTDKDNLLIYYAGHGELDRVNLRGYWLPVDAEPNSTTNWISNIAITDILNAMSAKHILVVADSCYSGSLTRSSMARLDVGMSYEIKTKWLKVMAKTRSRTVLTSGGLKPVLDQGGGKHSVFAKSFLKTLSENNSVLEAYTLFRGLAKEVQQTASKFGIDQIPEYAPIKHGGHEAGEFFFIPQG
ncbi:MAG: caspase family protein [Candidatus Thiodiazotropha sp. (ex. Lucinisca nassula)]|nr:caspase family protein [Candidatus Thiodiazotropha sp. (ex. Lucinisca nassula)]MBW9260453.1 caspase family protein [Candidatus Thiodiazotropha sp. (ex. Lucinisca nassula)]MBW9271862.1 caspase family protein [Candidatus Thiodiazotropha sp. (ex. Lucinisca nassula)]